MRALLMPFLLIATVACSLLEPLEPPLSVGLDTAFTLRVGQEAVIEGTSLRLRFIGVPEDSRCPIDALCVWSGDALVRVTVDGLGGGEESLALHTHVDPRSLMIDGHRLVLESLLPAQRSDRGIAADAYLAEFRVEPSP